MCGQFQPCATAQTNPTPDLLYCNPNLKPNANPYQPFGGVEVGTRSAGAVLPCTYYRILIATSINAEYLTNFWCTSQKPCTYIYVMCASVRVVPKLICLQL